MIVLYMRQNGGRRSRSTPPYHNNIFSTAVISGYSWGRYDGGIAGASRFSLPKLLESATEILIEGSRGTLIDESYLFSALQNNGFRRSFPPKGRIQNEAGLDDFLFSKLSPDNSKEDPQENKFLQLCYYDRWLQAELMRRHDSEVYIFPSRIYKLLVV